MAAELSNPVLDRMRTGDVALGMSVRLSRSADIAHIAKTTGHDFLFIDAQHAIFDLETIAHLSQAANLIGVAPIVRVRGIDDPDVSLLLDNGVTGIVYPDISTPEQARQAVATTRFPPVGSRSLAGLMGAFGYTAMPFADAMAELNRTTLVSVMIEDLEGLENVEEIAAVDGIDVIHVGTNDLLIDMGKAGQFDAPEVVEIYERTVAAAKAHGKFAGAGGNRDAARQLDAIRKGIQFVTTHSDIGFILGAARRWTGEIRAGLSGESGVS